MILFPIVALSGQDCYNIIDYVEENKRFIEKMGQDFFSPTDRPFYGLDGNPYLSMYQMQAADEKFVFDNKLIR